MAVAVRVFVDSVAERSVDLGRPEDSFAELCARWRSDLVALCRSQLGPGGDAEAAAQEALVRAWLSLDRYSSARPFWPWVATIARRLCVDQLRRRQCEQRHVHHEHRWQASAPEEPEFQAERQEEHRAAMSAFHLLRPRDQRLIGRRHIDGWSLEQLATLEGLTVEAARTALKRAHAALRASYERTMASSPVAAILGLLIRTRRRLNMTVGKVGPTGPLFLASRGGELLMVVLVVASAGGTAQGVAQRKDTMPAFEPSATASTPDQQVAAATPSDHGPAARPGGSFPADAHTDDVPTDAGDAPSAGASHGPITFDRVASPEDAEITDVTPSPDYVEDGLVFATGVAKAGCATYRCPVLFVSHDRGVTWQRLAGESFDGDRILLPPSYPRDRRIFASGPTMFQVSDDGGLSFQPLSLVGGDAAMSPGFSALDKRVLIGALPRWSYEDTDGLTHPSRLVVPSSGMTATPEFAPDVVDGSVLFVGGTSPDGGNSAAATVFRCDRVACASRAVLPNSSGAPRVRVSPSFTSTGEAFAWRGDRLFLSTNGGASFEQASLPPAAGAIRDVRFGNGSVRYLATAAVTGGAGGLLRSIDGGHSWSAIYDPSLEALSVLPDGRLLVGLERGGLACSQDDGRSWATRCT